MRGSHSQSTFLGLLQGFPRNAKFLDILDIGSLCPRRHRMGRSTEKAGGSQPRHPHPLAQSWQQSQEMVRVTRALAEAGADRGLSVSLLSVLLQVPLGSKGLLHSGEQREALDCLPCRGSSWARNSCLGYYCSL